MSRVLPIFSTNLAVDFLARLLLLPPLPPLVLPDAEAAAAEATEGTGTNSCKRRRGKNCIAASLERGHPATEATAGEHHGFTTDSYDNLDTRKMMKIFSSNSVCI